ncbi:FKBP-type peptidyl-prolyl cis-trans isomerase [Hymenobacter chitinivorans]|uniref:Peptidyl-prolyl cis-trans isomerase n=1 Tax=Hymenobacter chitinivorans DSM 11115 TaxID=1121954 RepID=A0A2M9AQ03_9BACT|nr:FKBP-type peptidyl-prolyl cis-trans isomerase [Hymenobacter chitinivorans]PJJ47769.1 FKBP-type peptidyl-prolyl isomerase-like protein [Hymenobacter chitinivorans DSM 11115]
MLTRFFSRSLFVLVSTLSLLSACQKDDKDYSQVDEGIIKQYVADNKLTGAQRQNSGLYFAPTNTTTGVQPKAGQTVSVLYTGLLLDGTVFDASSKHGGTPISFTLGAGQVIKGWDEGISLMTKGSKAMLLIPSQLAYGSRGAGTIPPNTVLRFDVELVDVK